MLLASQLPLFFWPEAIAPTCYTQNRSLIIPRHEKTLYHTINERKTNLKFLHIFGCTCYLVRDGENVDKIREKGDPCTFVGYATQSNGYWVYNKRTRLIVESIHINFDELKEVMTSDDNTSGLIPKCQMTYDHNNVNVEENNNDQAEAAQFEAYEFINPFAPTGIEADKSSSRNVDTSNMHTFYQRYRSEYHWTKDHPLEQVRGNLSNIAEPKNIKEAIIDHSWIEAMQEEVHQFDRLNVWELVDKPFGKTVINLKWLYILKKHGMDKCDSIGTPMATLPKLDADLSGTLIDKTRYQSMKGSLMYLTESRPDLVQAVYVDHAGCLDTRKSTSRGIQFLGDKLVSWMSKMQDCTAMLMRYLAFGRHLEGIHVTWAHLEKKQTRLQTYTNISQDYVLNA
ncbi:retrovirus-related pol polyprotein from transposon TNT 1-94 [Tanacetum coccineum]